MKKEVFEFISKQSWEQILEWKSCKICNATFPIYEWDKKLLDKISPKIWDEKFLLPTPDECPVCRQKQRLLFRNENTLYKVKSSVSWKPLISIFSEDLWLNIHSFQEFYDWADFGKDVGINNEQFDENIRKLLYNLPQVALQNGPNMENSEYNNLSWNLKNCYLCYDCGWIEDSLYCWFLGPGTANAVDCFDWARLQNSYSLIWCGVMNKSFWCSNCDNMSDSYFCSWCSNVSNCIGCHDIKNKEYQIFNREVTKDVFEAFKKKHFDGSYSWIQSFLELYNKYNKDDAIIPNHSNYQSENVIGWYMVNAKDVFFGWFTYRSSDSRYSYFCDAITDSMDVDFCVNNIQLSYNSVTSFNSYNIISCSNISESNNCYYCSSCTACKNCIWCYWLSHSEYYIFNKQYTKEEYEKLAKEILWKLVKENKWWRFLNTSLSLFPYNDAVINNVYPVKSVVDSKGNEKIVNKNGFWKVILKSDKFISDAILDLWWERKLEILYRTKDHEVNIPVWLKVVDVNRFPDNIKDVWDEILDLWIICEESGRIFRITKAELDFYRKYQIPLPKKHFQTRQIEAFQQRPSWELHIRKCDKCGIEMLTIYSESQRPHMYCEECFDKED